MCFCLACSRVEEDGGLGDLDGLDDGVVVVVGLGDFLALCNDVVVVDCFVKLGHLIGLWLEEDFALFVSLLADCGAGAAAKVDPLVPLIRLFVAVFTLPSLILETSITL